MFILGFPLFCVIDQSDYQQREGQDILLHDSGLQSVRVSFQQSVIDRSPRITAGHELAAHDKPSRLHITIRERLDV